VGQRRPVGQHLTGDHELVEADHGSVIEDDVERAFRLHRYDPGQNSCPAITGTVCCLIACQGVRPN
jgi:hypothetical protein